MPDKKEILKKYFGYDAFREGQEQLTDALLNGRDALGVMPTGAGKSICYQVPAMAMPGVALVISPLISLMKDQVNALKQAGIPAAFLNSTLSPRQMELAMERAYAGQYRLIYAAPERLLTPSFQRFAAQAPISLIAVDEAHCVSQWGQDFRPDYLRIAGFVDSLPKRPPVGAFTATATQQVRADIVRLLGLRDPVAVTTGFDRENLFWEVLTPKNRYAALAQLLRRFADRSGIVYCNSRKNVESVTEKLCADGFAAVRYHAGLSEEERRRNQEDFQFDRSTVMVATNAFGMGIDKINVGFVIHYNMPRSIEAYYQEAGRAGRDGEEADCVLLYSRQDIMAARYLMEHAEPNPELSEEAREAVRRGDVMRLNRMIRYCETTKCLRAELLSYFGQRTEGSCGFCANCTGHRFGDAQAASAETRKKPVKAPLPQECPPEMEDLLVRLKARRTALSRSLGVPAYVILDDKTLRGIAAAAPRTRAELLQIKGMGEIKADRYGEEIFSVVREFLRAHPELAPGAEAPPPAAPSRDAADKDGEANNMFLRCVRAGLTVSQMSVILGKSTEEIERLLRETKTR